MKKLAVPRGPGRADTLETGAKWMHRVRPAPAGNRALTLRIRLPPPDLHNPIWPNQLPDQAML